MITIALVGEVLDLARPDEHPVGDLDVAERAPDADVLAHRAPDERDLAVERVRRRRRPAGRGGCSRRSSSRRSAPRSARRPPPGAGRRPTPTARSPARSTLVESPHSSSTPSRPSSARRETSAGGAVDGRLVELVVAGDQHGAEVRAERDGARVGDRVGHVDELDRERARARRIFAGRRSRSARRRAACARRASSAPSRSSARPP